jgi:hypothetical protein
MTLVAPAAISVVAVRPFLARERVGFALPAILACIGEGHLLLLCMARALQTFPSVALSDLLEFVDLECVHEFVFGVHWERKIAVLSEQGQLVVACGYCPKKVSCWTP